MGTVLYHQVGATLYCSSTSLEYLHVYFSGDRLISRPTNHPWPVHLQTYPLRIIVFRGYL